MMPSQTTEQQGEPVLITGATGFVGPWLIDYLQKNTDFVLHGTANRNPDGVESPLPAACAVHRLDLRDSEAVCALIEAVRPTRIYHLAGQSYVPTSFSAPWETLDTNIHSLLNFFEAIRKFELVSTTRLLVIGSSEMYGPVRPEQTPITEETPFDPASPYAVSKIAQEMLAVQYRRSYGLHTVRVRAFNHIGAGQTGRFAVASFATQIAEIEAGLKEPIVYVGDLSAARDFTDVRDIVRAYHLTLEHAAPGAVYNVCSGVAWTMQRVLELLLSYSKRPIEVRIDPTRLRPSDIPILRGDASKLREATGWTPQIPIEQTLREVLESARQRVRSRTV
jgi:GDP-4-dehydro-6-deoxy-D-mannose reductase